MAPAADVADRLRAFPAPPGVVASERGAVSRDGFAVTLFVAAVHALIVYAWLTRPANVPLPARRMAVEVSLQAEAAHPAVKPNARRPEPKPEHTPDTPTPKPRDFEPEKPAESEPRTSIASPDINPDSPELRDAEPNYKATYLNNPLPAYPMVARRMGLQGKVVLNVEVRDTGRSGHVTVFQSSGHEVLDNTALETVKSWSFTPARQGGRAVTRWFKVPIVFSLRDAK